MQQPIPASPNEEAEQEFGGSHDSADYIDWRQAESVIFPKLKPSTKNFSLHLSDRTGRK